MRKTFITSCDQSQRGVAVIVLLFALSIFSVLSLTVLRNTALEVLLRTSDNPDVHVVLYAGGAGTPHVVGRLNIPTIWRLQEGVPDTSAEVRAPAPVGSALTGELAPGWAYAAQLSSALRVCCDGGDGACKNIPWDQQVPDAAVTPPIEATPETKGTTQTLRFSLSSADLAANIPVDPNAAAESPFLIRATRVVEGAQPAGVDGAAVSCRLDTRDGNLATGALTLQPGVDAQGRVNRVSAGSLELTYQEPKK